VFIVTTAAYHVACGVSVSDENMKKNIKAMEKQFKQLETDLKSIKKSVDDKDRFADVMNISFLVYAWGDKRVLGFLAFFLSWFIKGIKE